MSVVSGAVQRRPALFRGRSSKFGNRAYRSCAFFPFLGVCGSCYRTAA